MVGARKAFMWATAAGFISGCGPIVVSQTIDGKPLDQITQENTLKEKIKHPDASMKEDVKKVRAENVDDLETIKGSDGKDIARIETRSIKIDKGGKNFTLINVKATLQPEYMSYLSTDKSLDKFYAVVYDPNDQPSSHDAFAVVNTYSLDDLRGSGPQPIGTKGIIEINQLIEQKNGVRVLLTSSPHFKSSLDSLQSSNKVSVLETLNNDNLHSSSAGLYIKNSSDFSYFLDKPGIKNDPTTTSFEYGDMVIFQQGKPDIHKKGLNRSDKSRTDVDSIGGLSIEREKY